MDVEPGNISLNKLLFHLYYNPPGHACQEQNAKTFLFLSLFITFLGREFNIIPVTGLYPSQTVLVLKNYNYYEYGLNPLVKSAQANPY